MIRPHLLLYPVALLGFFAVASGAQSFQPKAIVFKGDDEYSNAELSAAANLKKGTVMTATEMAAHGKLLMDSGVFENLKYYFDGQDLVFQLIPSKALYPLQFDNLPFPISSDLDAKLHTQIPLYHGRVPQDGSLLDSVCDQLKQQLASQGIDATLTTAPFIDLKTGKTSAISVSIGSPAILVGEVKLDGASPDQAAKAQSIASKSTGSPYNTPGSASVLETDLDNFYQEQGYLQATVHASTLLATAKDAEGVHIPFTVVIAEGPLYHLEGVHLASGFVVSQQDFDKQSNLHLGDVVSLEKLRAEWLYLGRQYHSKGYMKAVVTPAPTFDSVKGTVRYDVTAEPGAVYTMGTLKVAHASDDLKSAVETAWPMKPGTPFNESAVRGMMAMHGVNPGLERFFSTVTLRYTLLLHDDVHTVDVTLNFEKKN